MPSAPAPSPSVEDLFKLLLVGLTGFPDPSFIDSCSSSRVGSLPSFKLLTVVLAIFPPLIPNFLAVFSTNPVPFLAKKSVNAPVSRLLIALTTVSTSSSDIPNFFNTLTPLGDLVNILKVFSTLLPAMRPPAP